jgi:hypothetical protein
MALNRAWYIAHDEPGDPGRGSRPDEDGDLVIAVPYAMREGGEEAVKDGNRDGPRTGGWTAASSHANMLLLVA